MRNTFQRTFPLAMAGIVAITAADAVRAQAPAPDTKPPAFEVASVKPHHPDDQQVMMVAQPGGRFVARSIPLRMLIRTAYRLQDDQVVGGPTWLASDRFDISARSLRFMRSPLPGPTARSVHNSGGTIANGSSSRLMPPNHAPAGRSAMAPDV
jgi:hypothetical protein